VILKKERKEKKKDDLSICQKWNRENEGNSNENKLHWCLLVSDMANRFLHDSGTGFSSEREITAIDISN
jgi:hypothetical protein